VQEAQPVPLEALHDEALAAEQTGADPFLERDADADALGGTEERVLLRDEDPAETSRRRTGTMRPGYGAPNATRRLPDPSLTNTVMNSDSPVISRLPAPTSFPISPLCCCEPSPKIVSMRIPSSMYIIPPASATAASWGSSSTSTNWRSSPRIS
jgi:hypothetical protein